MSILELDSVSKTYGSQVVSKEISMRIEPGSIHGLLGPNGAGKTTLLRMMATITKPDSGRILFMGEPLVDRHAHQMGYMPEERGLYKRMSVVDQLLFFAEIKGLSRAKAQGEIRRWMQRLQMTEWINSSSEDGTKNRVKQSKKLEELSKGMAQKLQFLCTIIHQPKLLILDEPFSGFDPVNADLIRDIILELRDQGTAVVFSTHRMDNIESLCDDITLINHGSPLFQGKTMEVRRSQFAGHHDLAIAEDQSSPEPPARWTEHPKFISVFKSSEGNWIHRFQCNSDFSSATLLNMGIQAGRVVHFSEHIPSIHEIFVQSIQAQNHA